MAERTRESIDKEVGLIPAGSISEKGAASYFHLDDTEYSVSVKVPVAGIDPVVVAGKCETRSLRITVPKAGDEEAPTLQTDLEIISSVIDMLATPVEVVVAVDEVLVADLEGTLYVDSTCSAITREQIAIEIAQDIGACQVSWDTRLVFPLITLADPLFHFSGTYRELLEELISPYQFPQGHNLAEVIVEPNEIRVIYIKPGTQAVVDLTIGSDIYPSTIEMRKNKPKQLKKVSAAWYVPKDMVEETESAVEERVAKDGFVFERIVRVQTTLGNVLLSEEVSSYKRYRPYCGPHIPGILREEPDFELRDHICITYTYEPTPNSINVHYIRDFRLMEKREVTTYYRPVMFSTADTTRIIQELASYCYNSEGKLVSEVQETAKGFWGGTIDEGHVLVTPVTIDYTEIGRTKHKVSRASYKALKYFHDGVEEWASEWDYTYSSQVMLSELPDPASIPTPKNDDYVEDKEREEELLSTGSCVHAELPFDPLETFDLFLARLQSSTFQVSITGKCLYDLRPGLWIRLIMGKDVTIRTLSPSGSEEHTTMSSIVDSLPVLLVTSVTLSLEDKEQVADVNAIGWSKVGE